MLAMAIVNTLKMELSNKNNMILKNFFLTLTFFLTISVLKGQIKYYSIPGIDYYLTYAKNAKNIDYLNDSISTRFNKINDTTFKITFFLRDKKIRDCYCFFSGKKEYKKIRMRHIQGAGKSKENHIETIIVSYLNWKNPECIKEILE